MNFLVSHDSMDVAKFDSLASHFCQINGHSSQSGEDAIKLLQKATSISHSLHVLTKTLQGLLYDLSFINWQEFPRLYNPGT